MAYRMPRAVVKRGASTASGPIDDMAERLLRFPDLAQHTARSPHRLDDKTSFAPRQILPPRIPWDMKTLALLLILLACTAAQADEAERCKHRWGYVSGCHKRYVRPWRPVFTAAIEGGVSHFDEGGPGKIHSGFGNITTAGGIWGARVGIDFFSWLGLEARYLGMANGVHDSYAHDLLYATTAGILDVRIGVPVPYVHPYIFTGIGVYNVQLTGPAANRRDLISSTSVGVPMGVGLEIPLNWHISLAAEATFHFLVGESFANTTKDKIDGGDFSTVTGVFRMRL